MTSEGVGNNSEEAFADQYKIAQDEKHLVLWIEAARCIAALAVVLLHCAAGVMAENDVSERDWTAANVINSATRWCVPVFVMISGALLLNPAREIGVVPFYKKRLPALFKLILLSSTFYLVFSYAILGHSPRPLQILTSVLLGNAFYHLWYLHMAIGLYLIAPFLQQIVRACDANELVIFCRVFLVLAMESMFRPMVPLFSFIDFVGLFVAGYLLQRQTTVGTRTALVCAWVGFALIAAITHCFHLFGHSGQRFTHAYSSPLVVFMSVGVFVALQRISVPQRYQLITVHVARTTLGIYIIHPAVLILINRFIFTPEHLGAWLGIPLLGITTFLCSYAIVAALRSLTIVRRLI